MNIYLLTQSERRDYDTYDSCVVAAPDVEAARHIHPSKWDEEVDGWPTRRSWASRPQNVMVEFLGVAEDDRPAGVICASFNAG